MTDDRALRDGFGTLSGLSRIAPLPSPPTTLSASGTVSRTGGSQSGLAVLLANGRSSSGRIEGIPCVAWPRIFGNSRLAKEVRKETGV